MGCVCQNRNAFAKNGMRVPTIKTFLPSGKKTFSVYLDGLGIGKIGFRVPKKECVCQPLKRVFQVVKRFFRCIWMVWE